jgi:phage tail sheath gpL-like
MPSTIFPSSLAVANAIGVQNIQFKPIAGVLPRKILVYALADPNLEDDTYEVEKLYLTTSPEQVGNQFGFGYELYRLVKWAFLGSQGVELWVIAAEPEEPNGTPSKADGYIQITASGTLAGTLHLYIAGEHVPVSVADGDSASEIETAIVTAVNADRTLNVTGSTSTPVSGAANITSKNKGTYGNFNKITFNEGFAQEFPVGVSAVVVQPVGGTGRISFVYDDFFDILGVDDEQNEKYFTELIQSDTGLEISTLEALSRWNGKGNEFVGNYSQLVQRPLRTLHGDTAAGSSGLNNLLGLSNTRKDDRTNGIIAIPGSPNHPQEIAALAIGHLARISNNNPAEDYANVILENVWPGAPVDRWTSSYNSRDTAVRSGISPTIVDDGVIKMQNVITLYRPDDIAVSSNGYRAMRNIAVLQNISNSVKVNFDQEKWQRITIVEDVDKVTDLIASQKVKDLLAVQNDVIVLAQAWQAKSWIYSASYTINQIKTGDFVEIRPGGTGFNIIIPIVLSGVNWLTNTIIQFDTALTVFTQ